MTIEAYLKPATFLAYCTAVALVVHWFSYYPPTTISLKVQGPPKSTYSLVYQEDSGQPKAPGSQPFSVMGSSGQVEFDLPDKRIDKVELVLGNRPGAVLIEEVRLNGIFASHTWSPKDVMRDFLPSDEKSLVTLTDKGLLITRGSSDTGIINANFHDAFRRVSQGRWYVCLLLIFIASVLYLITRNPYRYASYLSFLAALLVYVGLLNGIKDVSVVIFGGLFVLTVVELTLVKRESVLLLSALFFSFFMIELGFLAHEYLARPAPQKLYYFANPGWINLDADLGWRSAPNFRQTASAEVDGNFSFKDVVYTTDNKGRRYTPLVEGAKKHALFFGCSFTWGQGRKDDETMPYCFQKLTGGKYQSYNYGFENYGASQMYQLLRDDSLFDDVTQKEGILVYNFIGDHVYRSTPALREDRRDAPVFRLDKDGKLDGPFKIYERRGLRTWLRLFGDANGLLPETSPLVRFYIKHHFFGPFSRDERVRATAKLVIESKKLYGSRFKGKFYVVIYDKEYLKDDEIRLFASILTASGIHVTAVPRMPDPADEDISPLDNHPSLLRNIWAAKHLYRELDNPTRLDHIELIR